MFQLLRGGSNVPPKTKNIDVGTQATVKMKKTQTQTSTNKQEMSLNTSNIKLKEQVNLLRAELEKKTTEYHNDILIYNKKVNDLEDVIEEKNAEFSTEVIQYLSKISDLEEKLREKEAACVRMEENLTYRADKLDEYEKKIELLENTIENLEYHRGKNTVNMEQKFLALQQNMENKSERSLKYIADLLTPLQLTDQKNRAMELKAPAAMEQLIKMLQKSDDHCKHLLEQNARLIDKVNITEKLLYKNFNIQTNFHLSLANMFEHAINGILVDLKAVLPLLSNETKPSANDCLINMQTLSLESMKYRETITQIKMFSSRLDAIFHENNITLQIERVPEFHNMQIPVSILHVAYLPMLNLLRHQNQVNLYQIQMAYTQQFRGLYQLNGPVNPHVTQNTPYVPSIASSINSDNLITIKDISNQSIANSPTKSVESEKTNSTTSLNSKVQTLDLLNPIVQQQDNEQNSKEICTENIDLKIIDTNENDSTESNSENDKQSITSQIKPFKLSIKTKEFIPTRSNAFTQYSSQKNEETCSKNEFIPITSLLTQYSSQKNEDTKNEFIPTTSKVFTQYSSQKNDETCSENEFIPSNSNAFLQCSTQNANKESKTFDVHFIHKKELTENHFEPSQNDVESENVVNTLDECTEIDTIVKNDTKKKSANRMESFEGVDVSIVQKLGGRNSLVKLYFFVKDKAKVDLINVTDEELVDAILAVKQENTLKNMFKKDILKLVLEFIRKQKESQLATSKMKTPDVCAICFENTGELSRTLDCGHTYHIICMKRWFQEDNNCPVCRKLVVSLDDLN